MPTALTSNNFAILNSHVNAGDRVAYYSQLSDWGYAYAELALGVVNSDTLSGRTANAFFLDQASDEGTSISSNQLVGISLALMTADFNAREAFSGSGSGLELPVDTINDYHTQVFADFSVSSNGWTPDFALASLDTVAERESFWDQLLSASNPFDASGILISPTNGDSSLEAITWRAEVALAGVEAAVTGSNSYGPFSVALSNGGQLIGDGLASSQLTGTSGNDVLMGFVGIDTLNGGSGNDRLYGGDGIDILNAGAGDDFIFGGAGNDILSGQGGADTLDGGSGDDWLNGGWGWDELIGGSGIDRFYHHGVQTGFGTEWIHDFNDTENDRLVTSASGTASSFVVTYAVTSGRGSDSVAEAFVRYAPTGQIAWALEDGANLDEIMIQTGSGTFDLLA